jgi:hypothetical protein
MQASLYSRTDPSVARRECVLTIVLEERYVPRAIRFLGLWQERGWRLKAYGIAHGREFPRDELTAAGRRIVAAALPEPQAEARYGVGWVTIHDARVGSFVVLDWWEEENMLFQRLWLSEHGDPAQLAPASSTSPTSCVWELAVAAHERQAWLDAVLTNATRPDLDGYLDIRLHADV